MNWLPIFILTYVALGLQLGLGRFVTYGNAAPNLGLIVAVFIALNATREPALLGAFLVGLFQDLLTVQPIGLFALSYGLAAFLIVSVRQSAYTDHLLTHVVLTLAGGVVTATVLWAHAMIRPPGGPATPEDPSALPPLGISIGPLLLSALYTAAIAPILLGMLGRLKPVFGFRATRRR